MPLPRGTKRNSPTLFWLRVWPRGDCWEWRGSRNERGYGTMFMEAIYWKAHRWSFTQAKGVIPAGLEIDHLCRHRWCVKPSHLVAATHKENAWTSQRKYFCINGHPLFGDNLRPNTRVCKTCSRIRIRDYERRKRARLKAEREAE